VAWVPQRPAFSAEIVADELALVGGDLVGVADRVGAAHLLERPIVELSTGERQRVAIARALLRVEQGARWLLLDEPTAHLDPATAGLVMAAVEDAAARGVGVLLATHRIAAAEDAAVVAGVASAAAKTDLVAHQARITDLLNRRSMIGVLLGVLAVGSGIALTATAAWLIARASQQPPEAALAVAVVAVRAFGLSKGALRYVERLVTHDAAFRLGGRLRTQLWQALVRIGPARTTTLRRTDGVQRLVDDTDTVRDLVPRVLVPPLVGLLVAIAAVVLEAAVLPAAGAVLAVVLVVAGVGGPVVALLVERRATSALAAGRRDVAAKVLTLFDAAPDLIAFGAVRRRRAELAAADAELAATARRQAFGAGAANALVTASTGVATLICAWLAASAAGLDPVLVPLLALVPLATTEAVAAIPPAAQQWGALRSAHRRVTELTGTCGEGGSTRRESPSSRNTDTLAAADDRRPGAAVRLTGVDIRWPGAERPTLRGVDLDVPAGSQVAVVGPSGAGKSTLMALLLGFLDAERGVAETPGLVSWCPQEPQLVSTTVRENLRLGDPEADDDRLREALRDAQLGAWTDRLDVVVGAGGAAVSGGEAQRLAMARALLRADHASLVLLDEPTAHLDEPTARALRQRLRERLAGRTVVHVTHRLDEAAEADLLIEVSDGKVRVRQREAV
jgi:thiol reductant ABC exporter CydC subunit